MLCTYCVDNSFAAPSESLLLDHIRVVHAQDPDFTIQCSHSGCSRTFRNFRTYQNHKLSHVPSSSEQREPNELMASDENTDGEHEVREIHNPNEIDPGEEEGVSQGAVGDTFNGDCIRQYAAKWILKTRECRALTRSAMQGIIEDTANILDFACLSIKAQVYDKLSTMGISSTDLSQFDEFFDQCGQKVFDGVATFHQQLKFYKQKFSFMVRVQETMK